MQAFVWDKRFETGIDVVDRQHRQLVDATNELGDVLVLGDVSDEQLQPIFHRLADYARRHFADEEQLMHTRQVAAQHTQEHIAHHHQFIEQVLTLWRSRSTMKNPAETLHGFLTAWLTVHILGEDQAMARQIARIEGGQSAPEAYAADQAAGDPINGILLEALGRLYGLLSEQNYNLAQINNSLEQRVSERTQDLASANTQLVHERAELTRLLHKVEEAQQQLLQSEKMAAIGQLAAGVAHEINNPVGFVNSNLGTLKTYIDRLMSLVDAYEKNDPTLIKQCRQAADIDFLREDLPSLVDESREGLSRVTKIVQDLKDFSRVDQAELQAADLNAALESTLNVVWNELKYKADIVRQLSDLPDIVCVPAQINQVFMNLLLNAAQAIPQHGTITLRSGLDNTHAWFEIEDTGSGMSEAVQKRIFEPFYTTKPVGKGTGLGLSISYDIIVKKHHGRMDVRSTVGKGSCFRICLPRQPSVELT
ncbi:MAG: bacteriohemerythrin [Dechloromonas sp.]|nr:bacteriohemerythrin [Dechloromonas sp.]